MHARLLRTQMRMLWCAMSGMKPRRCVLHWNAVRHPRASEWAGTENVSRLHINTVVFFPMTTSLDLPDDLYRRVKSKSALEGRAVREVATALFSAWVDGRVLEAGAGMTRGTSVDPA